MAVPHISVLMANYNGERFLASAIVSLLEQSYRDFEIVVVDDGSTDSSPAILRAFVSQDPRVKGFFLPRNRGFASALNYGLLQVRGEYIARMDSDDLCHPDRLAKQVAYLKKHPEIFMLGCRSNDIDEQGAKLLSQDFPFYRGRVFLERCIKKGFYPLLHPSLMVRRFCLEELNGYREIFPVGEDLDLYARMQDRYGAVFENLPEQLYSYRRYRQSLTAQHQFSQHAWIQTLVMYSARCRRQGLPDPIDRARSLHLTSLPISASERNFLRTWYFFHRLYRLPQNKEKRSRLLRRAEGILEKDFLPNDLRCFPYPYLQLARASARSGDLFLFLRMVFQAWRSDRKRTSRFLWRKVVFLLKKFWGAVSELAKSRVKNRKKFTDASPRVSVVMTTYNRARYLPQAIASWQRQTLSDFELIVVDDGSTDSTKKLLRACARDDHRLRLVFLSRNYGIPYAANRGLEVARASLIARADSDDIALPRRLQRQALYMNSHPRVMALGCLCGTVVRKNQRIGHKVLLRRRGAITRGLMQGAVPLVHSSIIFRKSYLPQSCYKKIFRLGGEDYDLFLRMAIKTQNKMENHCFDNLPDLLMLYREHAFRTTRRYSKTIHHNHACALFSARRRVRGQADPLSDDSIVDLESLQQSMTDEERDAFDSDVAAQQLLFAMSRGVVEPKDIVHRVRALRTDSTDKGRFVWVALSAARHQAKMQSYHRSLLCLWEGLTFSPLWTMIALYDIVKTRRYIV